VKVFFQNKIVEDRNALVSVFDHGFLYGDGIYETVHAYDSQVFHWPDHFKRLKQSARRLELKCPWTSAYLLKAIQQVLRANHAPDACVRITVSRGCGPLGLDPTACSRPGLVMLLHPARDVKKLWEKGVSIGIPHVRRNHPRSLDPQIKSNNALNTIVAKMEGTRMGVFETVLLNLDDDITEGTTSNFFFIRRGRIYTPALSCGLLEGVTRNEVIRLARRAGSRVQEGKYKLKDLRTADEIFLTSTTLEIVPVTKVFSSPRLPVPSFLLRPLWQGPPGPITRRLHQLFRFAIIRGTSSH